MEVVTVVQIHVSTRLLFIRDEALRVEDLTDGPEDEDDEVGDVDDVRQLRNVPTEAFLVLTHVHVLEELAEQLHEQHQDCADDCASGSSHVEDDQKERNAVENYVRRHHASIQDLGRDENGVDEVPDDRVIFDRIFVHVQHRVDDFSQSLNAKFILMHILQVVLSLGFESVRNLSGDEEVAENNH